MKRNPVVYLCLCALFAALSAVCSQIAIPIGPVPINLTHLSVFLAAGLLGASYGTISQVVFVALGALGAPVFAGFLGGFGHIAGKTGGFIVGYIVCAFAVGFAADRFGRSPKILIPAMIIGMLLTYVPGILWFMYVTNIPLAASLGYCVWPFLPGDAAKIALSAALIPALHHATRKTVRA